MLSKLNLVEAPNLNIDPLEHEKKELLAMLDVQLQAVTNMVNRKPSDLKEYQKWYYKIDGVMYFKIEVRNKTLVLKKDKNRELSRIKIGKDENAPTVVQHLIEALIYGELDEAIAAHLQNQRV